MKFQIKIPNFWDLDGSFPRNVSVDGAVVISWTPNCIWFFELGRPHEVYFSEDTLVIIRYRYWRFTYTNKLRKLRPMVLFCTTWKLEMGHWGKIGRFAFVLSDFSRKLYLIPFFFFSFKNYFSTFSILLATFLTSK